MFEANLLQLLIIIFKALEEPSCISKDKLIILQMGSEEESWFVFSVCSWYLLVLDFCISMDEYMLHLQGSVESCQLCLISYGTDKRFIMCGIVGLFSFVGALLPPFSSSWYKDA